MSKATNITQTVGVSLAVLIASVAAVSAVSAHRGALTEEERTEKISEIAEDRGITVEEAESYLDEKKAERQAERAEKRAEFLDGLVEDGTLTQAQADELTTLQEAYKAETSALRESGAEREEIRALMVENRAEIEVWTNEQGINIDDIRPERGERYPRGDHRFSQSDS